MRINFICRSIFCFIHLAITFVGCSEKRPVEISPLPASPRVVQYPFDPLAIDEIRMVKQILLAEKKIDTSYRFYVITLKEPPKAEMLMYKSGDPLHRRGFATVFDRASNKTYEGVIDLTDKKVVSFRYIPSVTPGAFLADYVADKLLKNDPVWLAGLKKRGIHPDSIKTSIVFAGDMGIAPPDHRELICAPQYINKKYHELLIDGMVAYVDVTDLKVLKILDDGGKTFYKPEDIGYFETDGAKITAPATKSLKISQPDGPGFTLDGFQVTGKSWSFRIGVDNREGLIVYDAKFNDKGVMRPVLYRASVAEMFVPYGSTDLTHSAWNYFDVGAYRMGQVFPKEMGGMKVGADVPENSTFLPGFFHDEKGEPLKVDSVVAIYEEYGGPLTRHGKFSHPSRNLAVKYFTKVWNYDYGFTWIFHEDGTIDLKAELTGVVGIKGVNRTTDLPGGADETYDGNYFGTLVAPHVEAVNHQHFFSFRLDMDVDGTDNLVEEMNTIPVPKSGRNPWGNAFVQQMSLIKNESEGQRNLSPSTNRHWMIADSKSVNGLGQQKSYVLMPGSNATTFLAQGSGQRKMADFLESQLWVTAYKENESYPAGEYPNSRDIKDGLPVWTSDNESLMGKDVVVWYNLGITHIVRPEEWPIMNVHTTGFTLMPVGFFDKNPTVGNIRQSKGTVAVINKHNPPDVTLCVPLPNRK
jgi:primary-amine oxidase